MPLAPSPINGRPSNAIVGALITPNASWVSIDTVEAADCQTGVSVVPAAASAAQYRCPAAANAATKPWWAIPARVAPAANSRPTPPKSAAIPAETSSPAAAATAVVALCAPCTAESTTAPTPLACCATLATATGSTTREMTTSNPKSPAQTHELKPKLRHSNRQWPREKQFYPHKIVGQQQGPVAEVSRRPPLRESKNVITETRAAK